MKAWIVVEGKSDIALLRAVLPNEMLSDCGMTAAGRSGIASIARTLLVKYRMPLAMLFDTESLEPLTIRDLVATMEQLISAVAGSTPFKVISCVPELEAVFFDASVDVKKIFPPSDEKFFVMFARTSPKQALEYLFKHGGGPTSLSELLDHLTQQDIEQLRSTYPIRQLMEFLKTLSATRSKANA